MLNSFSLARSILVASIISLLFAVIFAINTYAGTGLVSTVGGATFIQGATQFWVTSQTPTFSGVTTAGSTISGTVGSEAVSATADTSGNWSWTPSIPLSGDNPVTIASGSESVSFTLTIGAVPATVASASGSTLPPAGTSIVTYLILTGGVLLLVCGTVGVMRTRKVSYE